MVPRPARSAESQCAHPGMKASFNLVLSSLAGLNVSGRRELRPEEGWEVWWASLFFFFPGRNVEPAFLGVPTPPSEKNRGSLNLNNRPPPLSLQSTHGLCIFQRGPGFQPPDLVTIASFIPCKSEAFKEPSVTPANSAPPFQPRQPGDRDSSQKPKRCSG